MRDFEDFFPHVMPYAPGCPEPTAINHLRQAAIEFCQRTRLWRDVDTFDVTADSCNFVCVPSDAQLFEIEHASFNGVPLDPVSIGYLDREHPWWRHDRGDRGNQPKYITQLAPDTVQIVNKAAGKVTLHTILTPTEDAEQVPDWLVDKYRRNIAAGALADLLVLPGQPFFNAELAAAFAARWTAALDGNFSMNVKGQQRAPLRTRPQFL